MSTTVERPAPDASADAPALAPGVELHGEVRGSGYGDRQYLVARDGSFVQLSELLYRVAEHADGRRTPAEIATLVTEATPWLVTGDDVEHLLRTKLRPLALVASPRDGAPGEPTKAPGEASPPHRSPLRLGLRRQVVGPARVDVVARVLQVLFWPPLLVPLVGAVVAGHVHLYVSAGSRPPLAEVAARPALLLVVLATLLLASAFHELGHAAALRYGGGRARGIGAGIYIVFPAFYTDVTDGYRLGRWPRVRTDLGGVWFHSLFALGVIAVHAATEHPVLVLIVMLIDVDILRQFLPFVRLDGYWVLADLTGVPDPLSHGVASIRSMLTRGAPGAGPRLRRSARAALVAHLGLAALAVPTLLVLAAVHLTSTTRQLWASLRSSWLALAHALLDGRFLGALADAATVAVLAIQLLAVGWFVYAFGLRPLRATWRWARSRRGGERIGESPG